MAIIKSLNGTLKGILKKRLKPITILCLAAVLFLNGCGTVKQVRDKYPPQQNTSVMVKDIEVDIPYYQEDDLFCKEDIKVSLIFEDDTTGPVDMGEIEIIGIEEGEKISDGKMIKIKYRNIEKDVELKAITLLKIKITTPPAKQHYAGDNLDLGGMEVTAYYSNDMEAIVNRHFWTDISPEEGSQLMSVGQISISVSYKGYEATANITVLDNGPDRLKNIEVIKQPDQIGYWQGDALNLDGIKVIGYYGENNTTKDIPYEELIMDPNNGSSLNITGERTINVSYQGKPATTTVNVSSNIGEMSRLSSISATQPSQSVYSKNDALKVRGITVTANWSNGYSEKLPVAKNSSELWETSPVSGSMLTEVSANYWITVSYLNKTTAVTVSVSEYDLSKLKGITVTQPDKAAYWQGDELDLGGMKVIGTFLNNGGKSVTEDLTGGWTASPASGSKLLTVNVQTITVILNGNSATTTVNVSSNIGETSRLSSISATQPSKNMYVEGDRLQVRGIKITANWSNGYSELLPTAKNNQELWSITPVSGSVLEEVSANYWLTVKYLEATTLVTVNVVSFNVNENELTGLRITQPDKWTYYQGDILNLNGMTVIGTFKNNRGETNEKDLTQENWMATPASGNMLVTIGIQNINVSISDKTATTTVNVSSNLGVAENLKSIKASQPSPNMYYKGNALNLTEVRVTATYENGWQEYISTPNWWPAAVPTHNSRLMNEGIVSISIMYGGKTTETTVNVLSAMLESITVSWNSLIANNYVSGSYTYRTVGHITANYSDDRKERISTDNPGASYIPVRLNHSNGQRVTVNFADTGVTRSASIALTGQTQASTAATVDRIEIIIWPNTDYYEGDRISTAGIVARLYWNDDRNPTTTNNISLSPIVVPPSNGEAPTHSLVVSVPHIKPTANQIISVNSVVKLGVTWPFGNTITPNTLISANMMQVVATYNNGHVSENFKWFTFTPTSFNVFGEQTITVSVSANPLVYTITTVNIAKTPVSLRVVEYLDYQYAGTTFNIQGEDDEGDTYRLCFKVVYNDGSESNTINAVTSNVFPTQVPDAYAPQTFTVSYATGNPTTTVTGSFTIDYILVKLLPVQFDPSVYNVKTKKWVSSDDVWWYVNSPNICGPIRMVDGTTISIKATGNVSEEDNIFFGSWLHSYNDLLSTYKYLTFEQKGSGRVGFYLEGTNRSCWGMTEVIPSANNNWTEVRITLNETNFTLSPWTESSDWPAAIEYFELKTIGNPADIELRNLKFTNTPQGSAPILTGISATLNIPNTIFVTGDILTTADIKVMGTDGITTQEITNLCTFTPALPYLLTAGASSDTTRNVTINYQGFTANIPIRVLCLSAIRITHEPANNEYPIGSTEFDWSGLTVAGRYGNPHSLTRNVTGYTITTPNSTAMNTVGNKRVTVNYQSRTAAFDIKVINTATAPDNGDIYWRHIYAETSQGILTPLNPGQNKRWWVDRGKHEEMSVQIISTGNRTDALHIQGTDPDYYLGSLGIYIGKDGTDYKYLAIDVKGAVNNSSGIGNGEFSISIEEDDDYNYESEPVIDFPDDLTALNDDTYVRDVTVTSNQWRTIVIPLPSASDWTTKNGFKNLADENHHDKDSYGRGLAQEIRAAQIAGGNPPDLIWNPKKEYSQKYDSESAGLLNISIEFLAANENGEGPVNMYIDNIRFLREKSSVSLGRP